MTRQRRQTNKVVRIKDGNDEWIEEEEQIIKNFGDFYNELFQTEGMRDWQHVLDYVPKLVTNKMNQELMKKVEEEEIKRVVF